MVRLALAMAFVGLNAVGSSLPGSTQGPEDGQPWIDAGDDSFRFGSSSNHPTTGCLPGIPLNQQPSCIQPATTGELQSDKRSEPVGAGSYAHECPSLEGGEMALESLRKKKNRSQQETIIMEKLKSFLLACGVTTDPEPDGTPTGPNPLDKRSKKPVKFDSAGLEVAYQKLIRAIGKGKPSFITWLTLEQISSTLDLYKAAAATAAAKPNPHYAPPVSSGFGPRPNGAPQVAKLQSFNISDVCQLADIVGLKGALAALYAAYGPPEEAPENVFLIDQVIVSTLQLCGQSVSGWTTITPNDPKPGGSSTPDSSAKPGGPIHSSNTRRGMEDGEEGEQKKRSFSDPRTLLFVLRVLEREYGTYWSGEIPIPIFLIMVNTVAILQDIPGVIVPGWPMIGRNSVGS